MSEVVKESNDVPSGYDTVQLGPKSELIPSEWNIKSLSSWLTSLETGGRPKTSERSESDSVLSIGAAHISDGSFDLDGPVHISEDYYEELNSGKIEEDDILLVKDGATIGKSTYVYSVPEDRAAINSHVYILRVNPEEYDPQFLYHFIRSQTGLDQILRLTTGSAQAGLNRTFQQGVKVPTPPLSEQRQIAYILSTVDKQIQQTKKIVVEARELMRGLMQDLFEKGVSKETKTEGTPYGPIPKNWDLKPLKDLTVSGISYGAVKPGDYHEQGVPMVRAKDIENGRLVGDPYRISQEKAKEYQRTEIKQGDILLSIMGTVGRSMCAPSNLEGGNVNRALCTIRVNQEDIVPKFVDFWFRSNKMQSFFDKEKYGSAQKRLNISFLNSMKVPVPPYHEQEVIVNTLQKLEEKIQQETEYRGSLQELKTGLMQDLLTGKVRVDTD